MDKILNKPLSERIKKRVKTKNKSTIQKPQNEVFKCPVCSKEFSHKSSLQVHSLTHSTVKPYACELCPYRGITRKYLTCHVKKVHLQPSNFKCEVCGKMFHYHSQLKHHMLVHTGEKPFKCTVCGKAFNSTYTLSTHKYIHTNEKPFQCVFCDYACRDSSTLRKHQEKHMGIERLYQCKLCEKRCKSKRQLKHHVAEKHLNLDIKRHACPHCVMRFRDKGILTSHIKEVHDKAKARLCEICGVTISNKWNLTQHMRTHVDARPYKCKYQGCQTKFKDPSSLAKHVKRHKGLLYPNRLTCDDCGRSFRNKTSIINHMRTVHDRKRPQYICDICSLVTRKKRSIIKHIKYGHISEMETECRICKREYRNHEYLKNHYYKLHGVKFSNVVPQKLLCIKEELDEVESIDLFEIEKHELFDDFEITVAVENNVESNEQQNADVNTDTNSYQNGDLTEISEDTAKNIIENNRKRIEKVPEAVFDQFYIDQVMKSDVGERKPKEDIEIDKNKEEYVRKRIKKLLVEVRQKKEARALEKARQVYNERIVAAVKNAPKKEPIKIKYFNNNKLKTKKPEGNDQRIDDDDSLNDNKLNTESLNEEDGTSCEQSKNDEGKNKTVKFNTHQCYICFKLFETKDKLVEHCTQHFDICNNTVLTKCPLCDYVAKTGLTKHIRVKHNVRIKLPYGRITDNNDNTKGSRYYYEVNQKNDAKINKIEIIPSVRNLNKMASLKIDKKRRELNDKVVAKTRLVKKGGNWLVEREAVEVNVEGIVLPKFDSSGNLKMPKQDKSNTINVKVSDKNRNCSFNKVKDSNRVGDSVNNVKLSGNCKDRRDETREYLEGMRKLYHAAKKSGKKIMFPCKNCDKICQTLAALKLHVRKHDPNAKPFKPKIWKHKLEKLGIERKSEKRAPKPNMVHRTEKPKPIVNRHNCDPELMKFYENNIRGGDIEFWQFLKIFNKMGRENVNDFRDLEERTDFGIHLPNEVSEASVPNVPEASVPSLPEASVPSLTEASVPNVPEAHVPVPEASQTKTARTKTNISYTRVIRLSKKEYIRRNNIKNKMREKFSKQTQNDES